MHDHFPEPVDAAMVPTKHDRSLEENFCRAIELFLKKALHEEKPRDQQYIYLQPSGDYNVRKPIAGKPLDQELYKMQNKDPRFDKLKAEIHIDNG